MDRILRTVYVVGKDGKVILAERGAPDPEDMLEVIRNATDG